MLSSSKGKKSSLNKKATAKSGSGLNGKQSKPSLIASSKKKESNVSNTNWQAKPIKKFNKSKTNRNAPSLKPAIKATTKASKNASTKATPKAKPISKITLIDGQLTSKQRAKLKALANGIDPIFQIGKDGNKDSQLSAIADALSKRELIKITVLKNSGLNAKDFLEDLSSKLSALPVCTLGNKIILFKQADDESMRHIQL